MNKKENRFFSFEVRAEQDEQHGNIITGLPIVYGQRTNIGPFDEVIEPGALLSTDLRDVALFVNHNDRMIPLARSRNNNPNSTMQLSPEERGLAMRADLDTENNVDAKALYSAVNRGDISGMSFAFSVGDEEWENIDSDHPTRHIRSIRKVFEVSAVTFPAYDTTEIQARNAETLENARRALENARSKSPDGESLELEKLKISILFGGK